MAEQPRHRRRPPRAPYAYNVSRPHRSGPGPHRPPRSFHVALAEGQLARLIAADPPVLFGLAWIGVVATGVAYLVWTIVLRRLPATSVSAYGYLVPVFAVLFAVTFLGEHPTPTFFLGASLVLAGVIVAQR